MGRTHDKKAVTRREFLRQAAVGAAVGLGAASGLGQGLRRAEAFDANYGHLSPQEQAARGLKRPKDRAGAIAAWHHEFMVFGFFQ